MRVWYSGSCRSLPSYRDGFDSRYSLQPLRGYAVTGSRDSFKNYCSYERVGSTPTIPTNLIML